MPWRASRADDYKNTIVKQHLFLWSSALYQESDYDEENQMRKISNDDHVKYK